MKTWNNQTKGQRWSKRKPSKTSTYLTKLIAERREQERNSSITKDKQSTNSEKAQS